ncbi:unnamed protein product [Microthlaspi erraticum]|uniref:Uncharacterized protein n=1 Tax=Microthlaspi erraticum TaxID=1685480 RepID=A0A6D2J5P9_9BRAS|nr:unnamed protein product [Microthlaspi erraticum]
MGSFILFLCGSTSSMVIFALMLTSLNLLIDLFSFLFTLSLITSFFTWRAISLLLNKVHSNLKLPLLTLTTNGVIPLLGLLSSLNLSLSDSPQRDTLSASDSSISGSSLLISNPSSCPFSHSSCFSPFFLKRASLTVNS